MSHIYIKSKQAETEDDKAKTDQLTENASEIN